MHGYFQQRGCEDVKHAKPLCIYANWASFPNLNMNLAEMNLFTSSHLRHPRVVLHMRKKCTAACLHIEHTFLLCSTVRSKMNGCVLRRMRLWIPCVFAV